jgi:hypothetical protein
MLTTCRLYESTTRARLGGWVDEQEPAEPQPRVAAGVFQDDDE